MFYCYKKNCDACGDSIYIAKQNPGTVKKTQIMYYSENWKLDINVS